MGRLARTKDDAMDCMQILRLLRGGDADRGLVDPAVEQHLAECPACRALAADQGALAAALTNLDGLPAPAASFDAVAADLKRERRGWASWRSLPGRLRWVLAVLALLAPAGLALARIRNDLHGYPPLRFGIELAALSAAALATCAVWLRPLYRPRLRPGAVLLILGGALGLPWLLGALPAAGGLSVASGRVLAAALTCLGLGMAVAAPTALLLGTLGRNPSGPRHLLPLVAAALAALVGLAIHCPITDRAHLLGGHAPVVLLLAVVGLLVGGRRDRCRG